MNKNMGTTDKAIRVFIAIVIGILYFSNTINGITAVILGVFAVIFVLTSLMSFCPLYTILGINTCGTKNEKH